MAEDKLRKGRFYPAPVEEDEVPIWMLAGGALLIVMVLILAIGGGIAVGGMALEALL